MNWENIKQTLDFNHVIVKDSDIPSYFDVIGYFTVVSIFPFIFVGQKARVNAVLKRDHDESLNKAKIYFLQCRETFVLGYYIIFLYELFCNYIKYLNIFDAYNNIRFIQEVSCNSSNLKYNETRKCYSWLKYTLHPDNSKVSDAFDENSEEEIVVQAKPVDKVEEETNEVTEAEVEAVKESEVEEAVEESEVEESEEESEVEVVEEYNKEECYQEQVNRDVLSDNSEKQDNERVLFKDDTILFGNE